MDATSPWWIKKQRNRDQLKKEREGYYEDRDRFKKIYQSESWQRLRLIVLSANPFCNSCRVEIATEVDHVVPLAEDMSLAFEIDNCQPLCRSCHQSKTVKDCTFARRNVFEELSRRIMEDIDDI